MKVDDKDGISMMKIKILIFKYKVFQNENNKKKNK
jgi:hypothetical protein